MDAKTYIVDARDEITTDDEPIPATAEEAALRAMAMAAASARALLEQEDILNPDVEVTRERIIRWVDDIEARHGFETSEWAFLSTSLGTADPHQVVNFTWRLEGLAVLA